MKQIWSFSSIVGHFGGTRSVGKTLEDLGDLDQHGKRVRAVEEQFREKRKADEVYLVYLRKTMARLVPSLSS